MSTYARQSSRAGDSLLNRLWSQLAIAANWPVLAAVGTLSTIGIASIWAGAPDYGQKQLLYLCAALAALAITQSFNYQHIGRYAWGFYGFSFLLVIYTVAGSRIHLPGVAKINGAYAWINLGIISLEPSELMKLSFVMVLARYLRFRSNYRTLSGLLPPFGLALAPMVLILMQPDLGVAAIFLPALFAMLFVAGARVKHLIWVMAMGFALIPVFWLAGQRGVPILGYLPPLVHDYQRVRVQAMFSSDPRTLQESGFQQQKALTAMGSGGLAGKGAGNIPIARKVPEARNDMVFAVIGEQFGFVGSLIVLAAYVVLFIAGVEISAATREPFGRLLALGIVTLLATQTFLNLMVAMRLFPVTGVTLPFVSYGGSSLVSSFIAAGLLLNIGQHRPLVIARPAFEY